jgi:hypothetical protein
MPHDCCSAWPDWITLGGHTNDVCAGSEWLAIVRVVLCAVTLGCYWLCVRHWKAQEAYAAGPPLVALRRIRRLFVTCSLAGYGSVVLLYFAPMWLFSISITFVNMVAAIMYTRSISHVDIVYQASRDAERRLIANRSLAAELDKQAVVLARRVTEDEAQRQVDKLRQIARELRDEGYSVPATPATPTNMRTLGVA